MNCAFLKFFFCIISFARLDNQESYKIKQPLDRRLKACGAALVGGSVEVGILPFYGREGGQKDLYGIWYVATQLGALSESAVIEFHHLGSKNPKWFKTLQDNITQWLENATPLDWSRLQSQDPVGKLKRHNFEAIAKKLLSIK